MYITPEMKMVDVVHLDIQLLAVVQRLNIRLGFRDKTVKEVCRCHGVDVDFFLYLVSAFHNKEYYQAMEKQKFPVEWIINYLGNAHRCYTEFRIPEIEKQIGMLEEFYNDRGTNMDLIINFIKEYVREFKSHIEHEELEVFPYILELNANLKGKYISDNFIEMFDDCSIDRYLEQHNNIEEKLYDLKNILLKYMPLAIDDCKYNSLLSDLFRLEKDLVDHDELEELVLFPGVRQMELTMKELIKSKQGGR